MFRKYWFTGFIAFLGLLFFSVMFSRERVAFADAALYLFQMTTTGDFAIAHNRFIAVLTQLMPVTGIRNGAALQDVMLLFSINLALWPLLFYLLTAWVDRTYRLPLVILCINILITTGTFYWAVSELIPGMSLMILMFALLVRWKDRKSLSIIAALLLVPTVAFAHPYIILPFTFVILFYFLREEQEIKKRTLVAVSLLLFTTLLLKFTVFRDPYDKGSLGGLRNFIKLFPDYFSLYSNGALLKSSVTTFSAFTAMSIAVVVFYARQRRWKLLTLFLFFVIACAGFVNICFPYNTTPGFYRENLYIPLTLFAALPFVYDVLPAMKGKYTGMFVIAVICVFGLVRIYASHSFFTERVGRLRTLMQEHKNEKLVIPGTNEHRQELAITWGSAYEIWLLSTTETGRTASLMIKDSSEALPAYSGETNMFLHRFAGQFYSSFPKEYFIFTDSVSGYTIKP